jgi:hypothetical protein
MVGSSAAFVAAGRGENDAEVGEALPMKDFIAALLEASL